MKDSIQPITKINKKKINNIEKLKAQREREREREREYRGECEGRSESGGEQARSRSN